MPQTRREIRDAKRRPLRRLTQAFVSTSPLPDSTTPTAPKGVAQIVGEGHAAPATDAVATEVIALATGPRRRDVRDRSPRRLCSPRAAMAGTMAALALIVPIAGTSGFTDGAVAAPAQTEPNALEPLDADAAALANTPESLRADPAAASRAAERQALVEARAAAEAQKAAEAAAAEEARQAAEAAATEEARQAAELAAADEARQAAELAEAEAAANRVVAPLPGGTFSLTSSYGHRSDPLGRGSAYSFHLGQDLAAPMSTPIHAAAAGTVIHAGGGIAGRSNNLIIVEHNLHGQKFYTWYVHMYDNGVYVAPGQQVAAGDVIGAVGSNGNSTGPHLHFEVHDAADNTIDPLGWLRQHGASI